MYGTAPCSCGLLHDLNFLDSSLSIKLYPEQFDDLLKEDGIDPEENKEERKKILNESLSVIKEIFGDWAEDNLNDSSDWDLITEVFGPSFCKTLKIKYKRRS